MSRCGRIGALDQQWGGAPHCCVKIKRRRLKWLSHAINWRWYRTEIDLPCHHSGQLLIELLLLIRVQTTYIGTSTFCRVAACIVFLEFATTEQMCQESGDSTFTSDDKQKQNSVNFALTVTKLLGFGVEHPAVHP